MSTLESANLNAETMAAMKKGADALKVIHNKVYVCFLSFTLFEYQLFVVLVFRTIGKVDATMNEVNEQIEHAHEIAEALANPLMGPAIDEASCVCVWACELLISYMCFTGRTRSRADKPSRGCAERTISRSRSCACASTSWIESGRQ